MKKDIIIAIYVLLGFSVMVSAKDYTLCSPSLNNKVIVSSTDEGISLDVFRGETKLFSCPSPSISVNGCLWNGTAALKSVKRRSVDNMLPYAVQRKSAVIRENYNQLTFVYRDYDFVVRAYDDGVAYRFVGKADRDGVVDTEHISYVFEPECMSYTLLTKDLQNWFEEDYTLSSLKDLPEDMFSIMPVMVETGGCSVLLAEADLRNYSGSYLRPTGRGFEGVLANYPSREEYFDGTNKLYAVERYPYIVKCSLDRSFPWRVAGIFDSDASILASDLVWLLSEKTVGDYSWIRPGKVLWDWWNNNNIYGVDFKAGINTETYMYMVDYAARHGIEYILIDEGWSGKDDLLYINPETDIPAVCSYAEKKGVGVCLWAKWINIDRQLNEAFEMMSGWGVKGVKIDFMDRNDARMVDFYERVAQKAAECRMLLDFHGSYPPEGMRARYPNIMTREGVVGLEYNKWSDRCTPVHQLIIPYLRQWAGPMDFTPGAMLNVQPELFRINNVEPMGQGTRCHQLAMYIVYESPLQMLSDSPSKYDENPECLDFLKTVPAVWDETVPLWGEIGHNIAVARRSGDRWFVGAMSAGSEEEASVDLSFLPEGVYDVTVYVDGINASKNAKDYRKMRVVLKNGQTFPFRFASNGGMVAVIEKTVKSL